MHTIKARRGALGLVVIALLLAILTCMCILLLKADLVPQAQAYGRGYMGARYWLFAEGTTRAGFEEWILLFNPPAGPGSGLAAHYDVQGYDQSGQTHGLGVGTLAPGQRTTINVNQLLGTGIDVSVYVQADQPIVAERALYFSYQGLGHEPWTGGCSVLGYSEPQLDTQP